MDYNPYENRENLDLTAKLDLKISDAIDFTVTGTYNDESNRFTPTTTLASAGEVFTPDGDGSWEIFNNYNNPTETDNRYRVNFRFRHRIGAGGQLESEDGEGNKATKAALIQNASYIIQAGYEKHYSEVGDPNHGKNFRRKGLYPGGRCLRLCRS